LETLKQERHSLQIRNEKLEVSECTTYVLSCTFSWDRADTHLCMHTCESYVHSMHHVRRIRSGNSGCYDVPRSTRTRGSALFREGFLWWLRVLKDVAMASWWCIDGVSIAS
jgi:hypothetical protein